MNTITQNKKVCVISGGTGYVGSAVAKKLSEEGMTVAVLYNFSSDEDVESLMNTLHGESHRAYRCNLLNEEEVLSTINKIEKELGTLYACIHTAGTKPKRKPFFLSTEEELREQLKGNTLAGFNFISACARRLKEYKHGIIIGITTIGVLKSEATKTLGAYIPTKYALQGILTAVREEMTPHGINVYSIAPGFMEGGMNDDIPKSFVEIIKSKSPNNKIATADDIALVIYNICNNENTENKDLTIPVAPDYSMI